MNDFSIVPITLYLNLNLGPWSQSLGTNYGTKGTFTLCLRTSKRTTPDQLTVSSSFNPSTILFGRDPERSARSDGNGIWVNPSSIVFSQTFYLHSEFRFFNSFISIFKDHLNCPYLHMTQDVDGYPHGRLRSCHWLDWDGTRFRGYRRDSSDSCCSGEFPGTTFKVISVTGSLSEITVFFLSLQYE